MFSLLLQLNKQKLWDDFVLIVSYKVKEGRRCRMRILIISTCSVRHGTKVTINNYGLRKEKYL